MRMSIGMQLGRTIIGSLVSAGSTLLDELVSYWPLSEQSGTRVDVVGDNDLTDNNTVGAVNRGPLGTVASFVAANNEYFSSSVTPLATDSTISVWFKWGGGDDRTVLDCSANYTDGPWAFVLSGALYLRMSGSEQFSAIPIVSGVWNHLAWVIEATTTTAVLNGVSYGTNGIVGGNTPAPTNTLAFGLAKSYGRCWEGGMAAAGVWSRALPSGEITSLFNSGNGKRYADLTTAEKVGLVSYWNLDEVSGTRNDSHGTNHLTDNNTVGSVNSGPQGTVASFVAAQSATLSNATLGSGINGSLGVTIAAWVYDTAVASETYYSLGLTSVGGGTGWIFCGNLGSSTQASIIVNDDVTGIQIGSSNGLSLNAWHLITAWYNPADKKGYVQVDTNAPVATAALTNHPAFATGDSRNFLLGNYFGGSYYLSGRQGDLGVWNRVLGAPEIAAIFNSGNGKRYADLTAGEKTGLVSYWNLDETSGTRVDSHGSNDLTDNNTVGFVINAGAAMNGAAASFVAGNAESLSIASTAAFTLDSTNGTTIAAWFYDDGAGSYEIASLDDGASVRHWIIRRQATNALGFFAWDTPGNLRYNNSFYAYTPNAWNLAIAWYDPADGKIYLSVNDGAATSESMVNAPQTGTSLFSIGKSRTGLLDEIAIWNRVLTSDERVELYNAGTGKFYPFT